jgi:glycerate dehydrogenase
MLKITYLDTLTLGEIPNLHLLGELGEFSSYETTSSSEIIPRIKDQDVVIINKVVIDRKVMEATPTLKLVCISATGTNNVDLEYAAANGILVMNVKDYSTESVAQSTFAMLFHLMHRLSYYDNYVKSGGYQVSPIFTHIAHQWSQLDGKIFGIIGLGAIGRKVAAIAEAFGAKIIYYSSSGLNKHPVYASVELEDLLQRSDFVSIHAPLNDKTRHLICYNQLNKMKKNALLINTGRGGIIKEEDLARAIDTKLIAGAALDVLEKEPVDPANPLLKVKEQNRLLMTPHIAWASIESRTLLIMKVRDNILSFINSAGIK